MDQVENKKIFKSFYWPASQPGEHWVLEEPWGADFWHRAVIALTVD